MSEQKIQEVLRQKVGTEKLDELYTDVILTDEEIIVALFEARKIKKARLHELAYIEKLKPKIYPLFTAEQLGEWVLMRIRKTFPDFIIDKYNQEVFYMLCLYFARDERYETEFHFDLNKGVALQGRVGCGKTTMFRAFNVNPHNSFVMISCRKIADEYTNKDYGGDPVIIKYSTMADVSANDYWGQKQVGRAYDDLGTEEKVKHYGTEKNVMEEIIQNRYDSLSLRGKTHITTNLSFEMIEERYGTRVLDRCAEMFNWHQFSLDQPSRRK